MVTEKYITCLDFRYILFISHVNKKILKIEID